MMWFIRELRAELLIYASLDPSHTFGLCWGSLALKDRTQIQWEQQHALSTRLWSAIIICHYTAFKTRSLMHDCLLSSWTYTLFKLIVIWNCVGDLPEIFNFQIRIMRYEFVKETRKRCTIFNHVFNFILQSSSSGWIDFFKLPLHSGNIYIISVLNHACLPHNF